VFDSGSLTGGIIDTALFSSTFRLATPLLLAALGGLYSERSGVVNIALEGIILFGAFGAAVIAYYTGNPWLGLLGGTACGALIALIHAAATVHFLADHIISGICINILALGVPSVIAASLFSTPSSTPPVSQVLPAIEVPFIHNIPMLGTLFSYHTPPVYLAFIVASVTPFVLSSTRFGLHLRACGENPKAAESLGINVYKYRYYGVLISGILAGLAGVFLSIGHSSQFIKNMSAGRGYIALAALIFGNWKAGPTVLGCLLFGFADAVQIRLQGTVPIPVHFVQIIPYLITIIILTGFIKRIVPPAAVGKHYQREG